ncbi:MAG: molecular chaperone TorD family protein [Mucispirillum sp.]|nr:molecular chaperone TorD family protein [Mucispirillum sp.]
MIDIQSIKLLMAGRAGVYGLLADIFTAPADMEMIYNLCKYLYDLTESVEVIDEQEEIMQGFKGLALWYQNAQKAEKSWVEAKLKEEFISVFKNPAGSIGIIFPNTENIDEVYNKYGYKPEFKSGGLNEMLSFLSHMAIETAKQNNHEAVSEYAKAQLLFLDTYIMPYVSGFCEALYEAVPNYGIFQYIAVILHGFLMLDEPTLKYF